MDTGTLKKFAQHARRLLIDQVSAKLSFVLQESSAARRENPAAVKELEKQIGRSSKEQVIDKVAYTWFNRFCALRFMDANHYTDIGTVSPLEGFTQPEILAEAKQHHIDGSLDSFVSRENVFDLLEGRTPSSDPQQEAYRLLLVAVCNYYNSIMPFLFEKITDYTELLMPDDLISDSSILAEARKAMTTEACKDVEVIGWLYQFYISEKKDDVFAALKKGRKIGAEDIPAATQLFTPNWIVRYLVENSLGRLWLLNKPNSTLAQHMDYYIEPETPETGFLKVSSPEEIKVCDPACGSGHMLVYAFDLLYRIYEEEGYDAPDIPRLILRNNLYGIEIDHRAGMLTYFALVMKAREKYSRFLKKPVQPHVCVLENIRFESGEIKSYMDKVGRDLFTMNLQATLQQFEETDNFGSLIRPLETKVESVRSMLEEKDIGGDLFMREIHLKVLHALKQADYLTRKCHVVVANPPYMEISGANGRLKSWSLERYPDSATNLFAMFMERGLALSRESGMLAMINMQAWMFLSSFSRLRKKIVEDFSILSMAHLGEKAFDSIGGDVVSTTAFVIRNYKAPSHQAEYFRLVSGTSEDEKASMFLAALKTRDTRFYFRAEPMDFERIPGAPISYWASNQLRKIFQDSPTLKTVANPRKGMVTADNPRFIRVWSEVSQDRVGVGLDSRSVAKASLKKWFPYLKGGSFRRWYGNLEHVVNWENDGFELLNMKGNGYKVGSTNHNLEYIFKPAISWTKITSGLVSFRSSEHGFLFDDASGLCPVSDLNKQSYFTALLNAPVVYSALGALNPTLNVNPGNLANIPIVFVKSVGALAESCIELSRYDWDAYETSWGFSVSMLLNPDYRQASLEVTYHRVRAHWQEMTLEMQRLEEENNRVLIAAYGLQDELSPDVPIKEITLTCNPHYRYGGDKTEEELEAPLLADTIREFISYAVGCMFGRYSIDKPGLILANQGETIDDFLKTVPNPTFKPDDDNVIPLMDVEWFPDDIADRFKKFLRVTFGGEHYEENLKFIEDAIGKNIRAYFLKDFYTHHLKMYKKRPIYWMFSSPKGSFNALIYMHRYRADTVSVVLNDYLREFRTKLIARKEHQEAVSISEASSKAAKTKALKEVEDLKKVIAELEEYERDVLYPLATLKIEIDLDDGVKVNYAKFGSALKKVPGLEAKED